MPTKETRQKDKRRYNKKKQRTTNNTIHNIQSKNIEKKLKNSQKTRENNMNEKHKNDL